MIRIRPIPARRAVAPSSAVAPARKRADQDQDQDDDKDGAQHLNNSRRTVPRLFDFSRMPIFSAVGNRFEQQLLENRERTALCVGASRPLFMAVGARISKAHFHAHTTRIPVR